MCVCIRENYISCVMQQMEDWESPVDFPTMLTIQDKRPENKVCNLQNSFTISANE